MTKNPIDLRRATRRGSPEGAVSLQPPEKVPGRVDKAREFKIAAQREGIALDETDEGNPTMLGVHRRLRKCGKGVSYSSLPVFWEFTF